MYVFSLGSVCPNYTDHMHISSSSSFLPKNSMVYHVALFVRRINRALIGCSVPVNHRWLQVNDSVAQSNNDVVMEYKSNHRRIEYNKSLSTHHTRDHEHGQPLSNFSLKRHILKECCPSAAALSLSLQCWSVQPDNKALGQTHMCSIYPRLSD